MNAPRRHPHAGSTQGSGTLRARIRRAFATLSNLLPANGSGAPSAPRAMAVGSTIAAVALLTLAFGVSAASAAPPESPEVIIPPRLVGTEATLVGFLNPGQSGGGLETLTYEFLYKESATECAGGTKTEEKTSNGEGHEEVFQEITGLNPGTTYTFCLLARNPANETSVSAPHTFKTTAPPETPSQEEATSIAARSATLRGLLNSNAPGDPGSYEFRFRISPVECQGEGGRRAPEPPGVAAGSQAEAVAVPITGLLPKTTYSFCLVAFNSVFEEAIGSPVTFTTSAASPGVVNETLIAGGPTTATVGAEIDPGGLATTYHLEYVTEAQFLANEWTEALRVPIADILLPASTTPVRVRQEPTGLQPGVTYHFRFVAHNAFGTGEGTPTTFVTSASSASLLTLPDQRAFELVSGAGYAGETYVPLSSRVRPTGNVIPSELPMRASENGDALAFIGEPGNSGGNGTSGIGEGNQFIATRDPETGWRPADITPEVSAVGEPETLNAYDWFAPDLTVQVLGTPIAPRFAAAAQPPGPPNCEALYLRSGGQFHGVFGLAPEGVCAGHVRATQQNYLARYLLTVGVLPATAQVFFQSPAALVPGVQEAHGPEAVNLYDSVAGSPVAINVLPGGQPEPEAVFGSTGGVALNEEGRALYPGDFSNVISSDGTRVFWTALEQSEELGKASAEHLKALYVRENPLSPTATTLQLDVPQAGATGAAGGGRFWTATPDGQKVFFADCSRLTEDSTAVDSEGCVHTDEGQLVFTGNDLYEYDFARPPGVRLHDLSIDVAGDQLGADVQGVVGASDDGAYVYFVAGGALAPGAQRRTCRQPIEEEGATAEEKERLRVEADGEAVGNLPAGRGCNLYVTHSGVVTFIAALAAKDDHLELTPVGGPSGIGGWMPYVGTRTAQVSPDGRHLTFESTQHLTGYDSSRLVEGRNAQLGLEIFVYDADAGGTTPLFCVSCDPAGAPPADEPHREGTYLPVSLSPTYKPRWMSASGGRVFFDTSQPLVLQDQNSVQDVYEWEREGDGTCAVLNPPRLTGGCLSVISAGNSATPSFFLDADRTGDNVFFTHRGALGQANVSNGKNDAYDARVNGGFPAPPTACPGATCKTGVAPLPPFTAPSSVNFEGAGNVHHVNKRKKHKKHHKKHHKKRSANHRTQKRHRESVSGRRQYQEAH